VNTAAAAGDVSATVGALFPSPAGGVPTGTATFVQLAVGPGDSTLPAASVARTVAVCEPRDSPVYARGEVQASHVPPSSRHSKCAAESSALNDSDASAPTTTAAGTAVIDVCGATVSTVNDRVAGDESVFPAASVARTATVCAPSVSAAVVHGLVQLVDGLESTRQRNVDDVSLEVKANVGVLSFVGPFGPEMILVSGRVVSGGGAVAVFTVTGRVAGVGSVLPAASVARTATAWSPSGSAAVVHGLVHDAHAPESTRQANVDPLSLEVKANVGVLSLVVPLGPEVIVVSGGVVSGGGAV
jgi:hypothetical protein